ncbi:hypothetical protein CsatB_011414 [Cannabis sativa]
MLKNQLSSAAESGVVELDHHNNNQDHQIMKKKMMMIMMMKRRVAIGDYDDDDIEDEDEVRKMKNNYNFCKRRVREPCRSFGRRCSLLVKEQRARFYILRRCITMLLCWHE